MSSLSINIPNTKMNEELAVKQKASTNMLWLGIFSIIMFFAGLTSACIVMQADHFWVVVDLPVAFWFSTIAIVLSSGTFYYALQSAKNNAVGTVNKALLATLFLAIIFSISQFIGWSQLIERGYYFVGNINTVSGVYGQDYVIKKDGISLDFVEGDYYYPDDEMRSRPLKNKIDASRNTASSFLYVLTFLHLIHLAGGVLYLLSLIIGSFKGKYNKNNHHQIKLGGIYWHFLGGLWVYLFMFLYFIH